MTANNDLLGGVIYGAAWWAAVKLHLARTRLFGFTMCFPVDGPPPQLGWPLSESLSFLGLASRPRPRISHRGIGMLHGSHDTSD